jgi:hypothetical protein
LTGPPTRGLGTTPHHVNLSQDPARGSCRSLCRREGSRRSRG